MLLCLCMVMSLFVGSVTAAGDRVPTAYDGNIEKKATFNPDYIGFGFPISANPETEKSWAAATQYAGVADLVMVITDAMVVKDEYWYAVEAAEGYELPVELQEKPWIFQNVEGAGVGGDSLIIQEEPVPEETVPETSAPEEDVPEGDAPGEEAPGEDVPEESTLEETEPEQPEEETPQVGWKSYADFIADQNEKILEDPSVYVGFEAEFNVDRWVSFQYAADPATAVPGSEENILDAADVTDSQGNSIRVVISGYAVDADGYIWYQVEAAEGYTLPDVLAENPYILNLAFPEDPAALNILPLTGMFQGESVVIKKSPEMAGKSETVPTAELPDFFDVTPVNDANGNAYYDLGDTTGWHENLAENGYHYVDASCVILIAPEVTVAYEKLKKADSAKEFDEIWESLPESVREQFTEKHLAVLDRCQEELNNVKYSDTVTYNGKELEVSVTGPIPKTGVELSVSPVSNADILNGGFDVKSATEIITALDIKILQENGTEWQPEDGKRIAVSIGMEALGIEDETVVRLHHKHGDYIEKFEVFVVLDGCVTVYTNGLSIYAVTAPKVTTRPAEDMATHAANSTINLTVGDNKIYYITPNNPGNNPVGTWEVTDPTGAIHYTVHSQSNIGNGGMYCRWIQIDTLKEATGVKLKFNYYRNGLQSETYTLNIGKPKATQGQYLLYLKDDVNQTGRLVATLVDRNGNEVPDVLAGASFSWERDDGYFISPFAYGDNNQSVNIARDHGGLVEARKKTDGTGYQPTTYTVKALLPGEEIPVEASYTVYYQSEFINAGFEFPNATSDNYTFFPNGWSELYWQTTAPGSVAQDKSNVTKDIEYGDVTRRTNQSLFGVTYAADHKSGGVQFAELNAEAVGALYQDIITVPHEVIDWEFSHAPRIKQSWTNRRYGNKMFVVVGPTEHAQTLTTRDLLYNTIIDKAIDLNVRTTGGPVDLTITENGIKYFYQVWYHNADPPDNADPDYSVNNDYGWSEVEGHYEVPDKQYRTRLFFASDIEGNDHENFGNLIDKAKAGQYMTYLIEYYEETYVNNQRVIRHLKYKTEVEDEDGDNATDNEKKLVLENGQPVIMDESGEALIYSSQPIENLNYFLEKENDYLQQILINNLNNPYNIRYAGDASLYIEKYGTQKPAHPETQNYTYRMPGSGETVACLQNDYEDYDIVVQIFLRDTVVGVQKELIFPNTLTTEQKLQIITKMNADNNSYKSTFQLHTACDAGHQCDDTSYVYSAQNTATINQRDPDGGYSAYVSVGDNPRPGHWYTLEELHDENHTLEIPGLKLTEVKFATSLYRYGDTNKVGDTQYTEVSVSDDKLLKSAAFKLSDEEKGGKIAQILVENIYEEIDVEVKYKAVGNGKVALVGSTEFVDVPSEILPYYSGTSKGAEVHAGNGATFVGWFKDEACTQPVGPEDGIEDANYTFKPSPNKLEGGATFYALFTTGTIVINRTGAPNQSFVYHVTNGKTGADKVDFYVTVECDENGNGSTEILEVLNGTYTITEETDWSWRYTTPAEQTVTISESNLKGVADFGDGMKKHDWLSGLSKIAENIFKGGSA